MAPVDKVQFNREHYYRTSISLPLEDKEKLEEILKALNMSINEYIIALFKFDISNGTSRLGSRITGFSDAEKRLLEKWQIPEKYHKMIENLSYSAESGYFIRLRPGYTNDAVGGREIYCRRTVDVRRIISKSHRDGTTLVNNKNGRTAYFSDTKSLICFYLSENLTKDAKHAAYTDNVCFTEYLESLVEKDICRRQAEGTF